MVEEVGTPPPDLHSASTSTICSQQPKNTDLTADSTKRNQNTSEDLDVLTKRWTILQHADCWNRNAGSGVSKCASRQCTSWRHFTRHVTTLYGERLKNAVSNHVTSVSWRGYKRNRKGQSQRIKKSTCLRWREWTKQGDFLSSLLFNTVLQMLLTDGVERWQKSKGMGKRLGDYESDCLTILRVADDVFLFSTSLVRLQKVMFDFKQITESRIENPPGQDDNSEQPKCKQKKRSRYQQH